MRQTFIRLQDELDSSAEGKATAFMNELYPHYREYFSGLWFRSLVRNAQQSPDIDVSSIVTNLQNTSYPWQENLESVIHDVPERNVLAISEVESLATVLPDENKELSDPQTLIDNIATLTEGEDMYSLHEMTRGRSIAVQIDLDTVAEDITARIVFASNGKTRTVPFHVNFAGDAESFSVNSLGDASITEESIENYRGIVAKVIAQRAEKIRQKKAAKQTESIAPASPPEFTITTLTREQRISRYGEQKEKKKKRKSTDHEAVAVFPVTAETQESVNDEPKLTLQGMDRNTIQELLTEGRIKSVDAQTITNKLAHLVEATRINKKMLGKRIDTTAYDVGDTSSINLRQINFTFDGGHTPIRVYVQDTGDGTFALRGILHKKGETQQTRYIKGLVQDLVNEQAENSVDESQK